MPLPPPRHRGGRSMHYSRSGGRGGRGHGSFKYVRPAGEPAPGSFGAAAGAAAGGAATAAPTAAAAAAQADDHMTG